MSWASDPKFHRRANEVLTVGWVAMVYPTVFYWSQSLKYLVFISVYTIIISHVTAALAARADEHSQGE